MMIQIGVESGYNEGLRRIQKGIVIEDIIKGATLLREYGLAKSSLFSFIIGFPWENVERCKRTIETAAYLKDKYGVCVNCVWWIPLPSKEFDMIYKKSGIERYSYWDGQWNLNNEINFQKVHYNMTYQEYLKVNEIIKLYTKFDIPLSS